MLKNFEARLAELARERVTLAAERHQDAAKARVPVDTGQLKNSIRVEADGFEARVVTDCPYAAAVEFGTEKAPPQPFMRG